MTPDEIIFSPSAERELKSLSRDQQKTVVKALKRLVDSSTPVALEKIKGKSSYFRMKAGRDLRIIFHPLTGRRAVLLVIRDRKDAYRGLNSLDGKLEAALHHIEYEAKIAIGVNPRA